MSGDAQGTILVAPHHFPDLDREHALAKEVDRELVAAPDADAFRTALPDAEVVMVTPYARLTAEEFPFMGKCRAVIRYGMGYDNIDVDAATAAGIPVAIVPGTASEEVASHAFAMGLALARRLPTGDASIRSLGWAGIIGYDTPVLSQLQVGVVGLGRIGQHVARMWTAVGAHVKGYDPYATDGPVELATLDTVLQESDVVSLHLPLNDDTWHLVSEDVLARMRRGAVVVNVSRGGLIDEDALAAALISGHLAGAGIDTFSQEPVAAEHPLRSAPNTILTPHIAWRSNRSTGALQDGAVQRARLALTGQPLTDRVN
ncbi:C-terminal binding protein [Kineococcus aurantiacus]|uniref:D-3-phosphoglycerate dehydrogenase n=1 Tax=Kineococcus aurantiacus TaxID=37633 RepID=A0A7Y9J3C0_9ACTN|nr:C-terminal binding protein [Kineococcus aurantiacus]NYD25176.1 D-3-phosphoglycerate dehydrogenase [Kineococcus aurantiacus]